MKRNRYTYAKKSELTWAGPAILASDALQNLASPSGTLPAPGASEHERGRAISGSERDARRGPRPDPPRAGRQRDQLAAAGPLRLLRTPDPGGTRAPGRYARVRPVYPAQRGLTSPAPARSL